MSACPSDLQLELVLAKAAAPPIPLHVSGCEHCRRRLDEMQQAGIDFRSFVYPSTRVSVVERGTRRRFSLPRLAWMVPALSLSAAVVLLLRRSPSSDETSTKGALGFSAFLGRGAEVAPVFDGERVPPDAALRFRVRVAKPCHLWIASVDGDGQVSRLFPPQGGSGALVDRPSDLPGGAILDGRIGPERVFAVCSPAPVSFDEVQSRISHAIGGRGAGAVRGTRALPEWPAVAQESLLLEKAR